MANDPKLENYLAALERALKPLPVSDRAEIVTEIKSHVLSALDRDPNATLDQVLAGLGEAETVANRYLVERGQAMVKPPISPIVKWVVIGFLGTFALLMISVVSMVWHFSPLVQIDGGKDHVSLLGGMIDIDGKTDSVRIGSMRIDGSSDHGRELRGAAKLASGDKRGLLIKANNGRFELSTSDGPDFKWDCRIDKEGAAPELKMQDGAYLFDLSSLSGAKCEFRIPEARSVRLEALNGRIDIIKPHYDIDLSLDNGKVEFEPDASKSYAYDLSTVRGMMDTFESSNKPDAFKIRMRLVNGKISRSSGEEN